MPIRLSRHRPTLEQTLQDIDLSHSRIRTVEPLVRQLRRLTHLTRLSFRQNLIKSVSEEVIRAVPHLEELDLYDNRLNEYGIESLGCGALTKITCVFLSPQNRYHVLAVVLHK